MPQNIEVVVVDINEARIAAWNSDTLPIFEPGLEAMVKQGLGCNLFFSTEVNRHCAEADIIFVKCAFALPQPTPSAPSGQSPHLSPSRVTPSPAPPCFAPTPSPSRPMAPPAA